MTAISSWATKRMGNLNRFYTRGDVGDVLAAALGDIEPQSVVDLGAGEGSLSSAVLRRWPSIRVTTVDVDEHCTDALHERLVDAGARHHRHWQLDVLDEEMPPAVGMAEFDLAICNPPFYRPEWQRSFARLLQRADIAEACPRITDVSAEILFFAQNLRLVRPGGKIALIVPAGLATGRKWLGFRRTVMQKQRLETVVQLPPYSFHDTEAHCFIMVVAREPAPADQQIKLVHADESGFSQPVWVRGEEAEKRLDWSYHAQARAISGSMFTLRGLGADIRRGSLSTVERRAADYPVFHTGDFPSVGCMVKLPNDEAPLYGDQVVVAEVGDILMARVDRDLHEKITLVASGRSAITDCVYRIRVPQEDRDRVFDALSSPEGQTRIRAAMKGVGARLIGKGELLDLPLPLHS